MISLDTNVLARWLIRDVLEQAQKVDQLLQGTELCFIEDIVFFELEHLMRSHYEMPRDLIAGNLRIVIDSKDFDLNRKAWGLAIADFEQHSSLSLADCFLAHSAAVDSRLPLLTFDKTLAKKLPKTVKLLG